MQKTYLARISKFKKLVKQKGYNGYATSNVLEIEYFTGQAMSETEYNFLLIAPKQTIVFAKLLAYESLKKALPFLTVKAAKKATFEDAAAYALNKKIKNIAFDKTKEFYEAGDVFVKAGFCPAAGLSAQMRIEKDAQEHAYIKKACQISFNAYRYVKPLIKTGMTELQVAKMLEDYMFKHGASGLAFDTIVAFGKNSAAPHHATGDTKLKKEDVILMDFGCKYKGYCSDITRTWWHGKNPTAQFKKVWEIVDHAKKEGLKKIKVGTSALEADKICRDIIEAAGYGPFIHSTGHGIGLYIHEAPLLSFRNNTDVLKENYVFTVEPGIYIPGKFGVRLEDSVLLQSKGIKILTKK